VKKWILLAAVALAGGVALWEPSRHGLLAACGRGAGCPPGQAARIAGQKAELTRVKDGILAASKLLRQDDRRFQLWGTPYGEFWTPDKSDYILPFNLAEQATHIYGTGDKAVRAGDVVLDCGANVGVFTRAALAAGARLVVAIEPAPDNVECLRRNFPGEIIAGRVIIYPKGVWDKEDFLEMNVDPENQAADSFIIQRKGAVAVAKLPLTTIDLLVAELKLERVDYIKMDIEGAEVKALEGARQTIARHHPRMGLSVYHQDDHPVEVPRAAKAAWDGYRVECGPCDYVKEQVRVRPDVLYFY
jgi:FkbM family methyltransferase